MTFEQLVVVGHEPWLVFLSVAVSLLGSYAAIELMERVRDSTGRLRLPWLLGAAVVDGIGTWSMHHTALLSLRLPGVLLLDWRRVVFSLIVAVAGAGLSFMFIWRRSASLASVFASGLFLGGIGISALHFTSMDAIVQPHLHHYHSPNVIALSMVVAVAISCLSLPLALRWKGTDWLGSHLRKGVAVLVRGAANPAMHYTAMAGVAFNYIVEPRPAHSVSIGSIGVIGVSVVPALMLVVGLMSSALGRLEKERVAFRQLFAQTPAAVAMMRGNGEIVRINREFTAIFGYAPAEAVGKKLEALLGSEAKTFGAAHGLEDGRRAFEARVTRKDGELVCIAGAQVAVTMPDGTREVYALMRDTTQEKRAEEALRLHPQRLIETQEAEGLRIARELHDEIGQALTGVIMLIGTEDLPPRTQKRLTEARTVLHDLTTRVRNLAVGLRPPMLDDLGLVRALEHLFHRYERQTGIRVRSAICSISADCRFRPDLEITAYRIVQEALTNGARHAAVRTVSVDLLVDRGVLRITIADRGNGFDRAKIQNAIGIAGMEERARIVGGTLTLLSAPGEGTRVIAELPVEKEERSR